MLVPFPCGALRKRLGRPCTTTQAHKDRFLQLMLNKELHLGISASVTTYSLRKSRNTQFTNHQRGISAERRAGEGAQRVLLKHSMKKNNSKNARSAKPSRLKTGRNR